MKILKDRFYQGAFLVLALLAIALYFSYQPTSQFYGAVFTSAKTNQKVVALTFDDGPNGATTQAVLNILKQQNVKATFFMVGDNVMYYPELAKEVADQGNEIGNHTTHHARTLPFASDKAIERELITTNSDIQKATGQTPRFFRPPFGFRTPWALESAENVGLIPTTWSDQAHDYSSKDPQQIVKKILAGVRPGGVIVLHDGDRTKHGVMYPEMLSALPTIISDLKQQGYTFVTMSQLYAINHAPEGDTEANLQQGAAK